MRKGTFKSHGCFVEYDRTIPLNTWVLVLAQNQPSFILLLNKQMKLSSPLSIDDAAVRFLSLFFSLIDLPILPVRSCFSLALFCLLVYQLSTPRGTSPLLWISTVFLVRLPEFHN